MLSAKPIPSLAKPKPGIGSIQTKTAIPKWRQRLPPSEQRTDLSPLATDGEYQCGPHREVLSCGALSRGPRPGVRAPPPGHFSQYGERSFTARWRRQAVSDARRNNRGSPWAGLHLSRRALLGSMAAPACSLVGAASTEKLK